MKIVIITEDHNQYIRYAENFMEALIEVFADRTDSEIIESEIIPRGKQLPGSIFKKLGNGNAVVIFYDPNDISDSAAQECKVFAKYDNSGRLIFYISSCQKGYAQLVQGLPNVFNMGVENHVMMAQTIKQKYYNHEVQRVALVMGALPPLDGSHKLEDADLGSPAD